MKKEDFNIKDFERLVISDCENKQQCKMKYTREDFEKLDFSDCKDEQQFKMKYIREVLKPQFERVFCIETEETVKGFPDVMCLGLRAKPSFLFPAVFVEFKYSNAQGKIKFQPTQPAFYRANDEVMHTSVVAYNKKTNKVHFFTVRHLFDKDSPYCMNEKAEVQL